MKLRNQLFVFVLTCVSAAFLQELIDMEGDGLAGAVFRCIQEMDIDNRMSVSTNQEICF